MNGSNRMPSGQGMRQQRHQHFNQHTPVFNAYAQHYPGYNPGYYGYLPNAPLNGQGYAQYPNQYHHSYQQNQHVASPAGQWGANYPPGNFYPPQQPASPTVPVPAQPQQYNPNAQSFPGAAQSSRPPVVSSQPSTVVSSSAYRQSTPPMQAQPLTRPVSQTSIRQSPPPLPQISQPLYAEPESPSEMAPVAQRTEIFVAPLPFYPPQSRVPWPIKYMGAKEQHPPRHGYFVWVANPAEISRYGGYYTGLGGFLIDYELRDTVVTPFASAENPEVATSVPELPMAQAQSESDASNTGEHIESVDGKEPEEHIESLDGKEPAPVDPESAPEPEELAVASQSQESEHSVLLRGGFNGIQEAEELPDGTSKPVLQEPEIKSLHELSDSTPANSDLNSIGSPTSTTTETDETTTITEKSASEKPAIEKPAIEKPATAKPAAFTPKSYADLFKKPAANPPMTLSKGNPPPETPASAAASSNGKSSNQSLADIVTSFVPGTQTRIAFLEPRGLVNSGNMCYMNSVLQILVFCIPFYDFLDRIGKQTHSFKSNTPLLDAMIVFMQEFRVIDAAESVEKLRMRLKGHDYKKQGEQLTPSFIHNAIEGVDRFRDMVGGKQQDAEEFLGFLLEELHVECTTIMQSSTPADSTSAANEPENVDGETEWQQVGRKQKVTVKRSSGKAEVNTPIRKIFGGRTRSELRVANKLQDPIEQELRAIQLDIAAPNINNIIDALKAFSALETVEDYDPSGKKTTKQNFIEQFPEVLIIHLKRFGYNKDGTQKIWKKIGYPLELEMPKEVVPRQKLNALGSRGLPKYRLIAVVYHHGTNAMTGHYTVDVRRQEGREWIRLDDTDISYIGSERVAEGGSEEDPKVLAAIAKAQKSGNPTGQNPYSGIDTNEEEDDNPESKEWQKVNGSSNANGSSKSSWNNANGATTPKSAGAGKSKTEKFSMKDNKDKVAYLLFYQKI